MRGSKEKRIARILVYGDIHLCSKNYGAHRNYPMESIGYFETITNLAEENHVTHIVGLGDFSFNRFHTLEYRNLVEILLQKQYDLTGGNRYEVKGNHDTATYGMTEYEYYVNRGLVKPSPKYIDIGNTRIHFIGYGEWKSNQKACEEENKTYIRTNATNIGLAHDFYKYRDTALPNYGKAIELDGMTSIFGMDYLICGHVHKFSAFTGSVKKGDHGHECLVVYLGCPCRPAYSENNLDTEGHISLIDVYEEAETVVNLQEFELLPMEDSFNLEVKKEELEEVERKRQRVDISDIVNNLDKHENNIGDPEAIIEAMTGIDPRYKKKAVSLLREAMA